MNDGEKKDAPYWTGRSRPWRSALVCGPLWLQRPAAHGADAVRSTAMVHRCINAVDAGGVVVVSEAAVRTPADNVTNRHIRQSRPEDLRKYPSSCR